jgi:hypothetical protein
MATYFALAGQAKRVNLIRNDSPHGPLCYVPSPPSPPLSALGPALPGCTAGCWPSPSPENENRKSPSPSHGDGALAPLGRSTEKGRFQFSVFSAGPSETPSTTPTPAKKVPSPNFVRLGKGGARRKTSRRTTSFGPADVFVGIIWPRTRQTETKFGGQRIWLADINEGRSAE